MVEYSNNAIREIVNDIIHSKRDREVLLLRWIDGFTYEQIAECCDLSVRQVKNIVYKAQDKVFSRI